MVRMPHWPKAIWHKAVKYDLSRIKALLEALDNPHLKTPPIIHVAGTNGKGSTIAFLRAIFESARYKVHVYTSPHLIEFNERIRIASKLIDDDFVFEILEKTRFAAEKIGIEPTFFEATTAAAFLAFSMQSADICLIEVGMGGRLDATNVVETPLCSVITSISYDHMEHLGNSLKELASSAKDKFQKLNYNNIHIFNEDGSYGFEPFAPYDKIIITAACPDLPRPIIEQLKAGGQIIFPKGEENLTQILTLAEKDSKGNINEKSLFPVIFVPFVSRESKK